MSKRSQTSRGRKADRAKRGAEVGGHANILVAGRIENDFDWLGIWYTPEGPRIAPRAEENHRVHVVLLYEQARHRGLSKTEADARVHEYVTRWMNWANHHLKAPNMFEVIVEYQNLNP